MTAPNGELAYADASALVRLVIEEPESRALEAYVEQRRPRLLTSRVAEIEVARAVRLAHPGTEAQEDADRLIARCDLLEVTRAITRSARLLASAQIRTLDAIHLATALLAAPDAVLVYDRRLADAAAERGLRVLQPGAAPAR